MVFNLHATNINIAFRLYEGFSHTKSRLIGMDCSIRNYSGIYVIGNDC